MEGGGGLIGLNWESGVHIALLLEEGGHNRRDATLPHGEFVFSRN